MPTLGTFKDRAQEVASNIGASASITLQGPQSGRRSFAVAGLNGKTVPYCIEHPISKQWEVGYGVYTSSNTQLLRTVVLANSDGTTNLVNFPAGTVVVWNDLPGDKIVAFDLDSNNLTLPASLTIPSGQTLTLAGATVAGAPTWSSNQAITLSTVSQPNVTTMVNLATVGTITSGTWQGTVIAPTFGGTGQNVVAVGDVLYGSATNTWSRLAGNTATGAQFLRQTGNGTVANAPQWWTFTAADVNPGTFTGAFTFANGLTSNSTITVTLGTITASTPAFSSTATWNSAGTTFTHHLVNITNTASQLTGTNRSKFFDYQVGGTSQAFVDRGGGGYYATSLDVGLSQYTSNAAIQANPIQGFFYSNVSTGAAVIVQDDRVGAGGAEIQLYKSRALGAASNNDAMGAYSFAFTDSTGVNAAIATSCSLIAGFALNTAHGAIATDMRFVVTYNNVSSEIMRLTNNGSGVVALIGTTSTTNVGNAGLGVAGASYFGSSLLVASGLTVSAGGITVNSGTSAFQALTANGIAGFGQAGEANNAVAARSATSDGTSNIYLGRNAAGVSKFAVDGNGLVTATTLQTNGIAGFGQAGEANNAVAARSATSDNTSNIFLGRNAAGVSKFAVDGNGLVTAVGGLTVSGTSTLAAVTATTGTFSGLIASTVGNNLDTFTNVGNATTGFIRIRLANTGGQLKLGVENSTGNTNFTNSSAYAALIWTDLATGIDFGTNNTRRGGFSATGAFDLTNGLTVSANGITVNSGTSAFQAASFAGGVLQTGTVAARFENSYVSAPTGASGLGMEIGVTGGSAYLQAFNRTTPDYGPLIISGQTIQFRDATSGTPGTPTVRGTISSGVLSWGTTSIGTTLVASAGDIVTVNGSRLRGLGTDGKAYALIGITGANVVNIDNNGIGTQFGGSVGVGIAPNAASTGWSKLTINSAATQLASAGSDLVSMQNADINAAGSAYTYVTSAAATRHLQNGGAHYFSVAASGTAGTAITWTNALTIANSGVVAVGTTVTTGAAAGDVVLKNGAAIDAVNGAGTSVVSLLWMDSSNQINVNCNNARYVVNNASTAASATAGTNGAVPSQVVGYWLVNIGGADRKIPYFAV